MDVETVEARVKADDLGAALHPSELADLADLPADQRDLAALRCWARKEAVLKGIGTGLGIEPSTIEVGRRPEPPAYGNRGDAGMASSTSATGPWSTWTLGGEAVAAAGRTPAPRTTPVVVRRIGGGERHHRHDQAAVGWGEVRTRAHEGGLIPRQRDLDTGRAPGPPDPPPP